MHSAALKWFTRTSWTPAFLAALVWNVARADESLDVLRTDVRVARPDVPDAPAPRQEDQADYEDDDPWDDDDDEGVAAAWGLGLLAATSPFWGPPVMVGDSFSEPGYFPTHPYQFDCGYMVIGEEQRFERGADRVGPVGIRAASEFGTNLSGIDWVGGRLLVETTPRLGLDTDFRWLTEERYPAVNDNLWLGDMNVVFRFAQDEFLQVRTGAGFNYLSDEIGSDTGFNFTYAADLYVARPWVISAELDLGWLGEATVVHWRGTLGANWKFAEAYVGYDYYDIGRAQVGGMVAGVRLWF